MSCLGGLSVTLTSTLLQCHHSTETAPVSVHNGILKADNYSVVTVKGLVQKWQKILLCFSSLCNSSQIWVCDFFGSEKTYW